VPLESLRSKLSVTGVWLAVVVPLLVLDWPVLLFFTVPVMLIIWWPSRPGIPPGHCRKCGYNLTGNTSGRCPECGTSVPPGTKRTGDADGPGADGGGG
jgi:hypothetical protein